MLSPDFFRSKFTQGLPYSDYVATGSPDEVATWKRHFDRTALTGPQRTLLGSFTRQVNVLVTSGLWCGDCSAQVPMLAHIANASPTCINLRILDRDDHADLSEQIKICGGLRVPTAIFLNEDFEFVSILGDKTLSRLRSRASRIQGAYCPLPGAQVPTDEAAATLADWVQHFEFVHLILRLSPKLRERHAD